MSKSTAARLLWLGNNWLIAIVGGALAALLAAYAIGAIGHIVGYEKPVALPTSPAGPILLQVQSDRIVAGRQPVTISVFISGLTPDGSIHAMLYRPDGATMDSLGAFADTQGNFTFTPQWFPGTASSPNPLGYYRIVIDDDATGATATCLVRVVR
jgi:hypothetical protein